LKGKTAQTNLDTLNSRLPVGDSQTLSSKLHLLRAPILRNCGKWVSCGRPSDEIMNKKSIQSPRCLLVLLLITPAMAQNQSDASPPVSYSSISQLNLLLSQLEQASQQTQLDIAKLRVEKWKTDSNNKRQMQANVESVERNLQSALPEMISQLRMSTENLTATYRLYRHLTATYECSTAVPH